MRFISKVGLSLVFASTLASQAFAADKIASVSVSFKDAKLAPKASGIHTMYFVLFNGEAPRPLGAVKVDLKEDAKGTFYTGDINVADVQTMGSPFVMPATVRIKARLDKDGGAGADQPGDLTGFATVKPGEKADIKIDKAI